MDIINILINVTYLLDDFVKDNRLCQPDLQNKKITRIG